LSQDPAGGSEPHDTTPGWQPPSGGDRAPSPGSAPTPGGQPQYGPPQYGPPQYGQPQYGQPSGYGPPPPGYAPPPGYLPPQYGTPAWGPPLADKPGVIPLRPLAVGEILDGAFATIRLNPRAMLGLSFVVVLVGQLAVLGVNLAVHGTSTGTQVAVLPFTLAVSILVSSIVTGAVIIIIGEAVLGTRISPADALVRLRGRIWRLVGVGLLAGLLTALAFVLIIPGIYVLVLFVFATPVFVLEKTGVRAALSRSAELVRGSWWRTCGIGLLGYLVGSIIGGVIQIPFAILASSSGLITTTADANISTGDQLVLAVGRIVAGTISTPIIAGTIALMYVDRRIRREGLDLVLAQTARERRGQS
jgi:hypothetical protein